MTFRFTFVAGHLPSSDKALTIPEPYCDLGIRTIIQFSLPTVELNC